MERDAAPAGRGDAAPARQRRHYWLLISGGGVENRRERSIPREGAAEGRLDTPGQRQRAPLIKAGRVQISVMLDGAVTKDQGSAV